MKNQSKEYTGYKVDFRTLERNQTFNSVNVKAHGRGWDWQFIYRTDLTQESEQHLKDGELVQDDKAV